MISFLSDELVGSGSIESIDPGHIANRFEYRGRRKVDESLILLWLRKARYREQHPSASDVKLAIEVADSSLDTDLKDKAALYAEAGIIDYWIVDASGSCVHVFLQPQGASYLDRSIAHRGEKLSPLATQDAVLDLDDLFGVDLESTAIQLEQRQRGLPPLLRPPCFVPLCFVNAFCIVTNHHLDRILRSTQEGYNKRRGHSGRDLHWIQLRAMLPARDFVGCVHQRNACISHTVGRANGRIPECLRRKLPE